YFHSVTGRSLMSVPVEGGSPASIAAGQKLAAGMPLIVDKGKVSFVTANHQLHEVAVKKGKPKRVGSFGKHAAGYARSGQDVFFWTAAGADHASGLLHLRLGPPKEPHSLVPTVGSVDGFAIGDAHLYWLDDATRRIMRLKRPAPTASTPKKKVPEFRVKRAPRSPQPD
ncbi:MAG: hypothetical protein ACOC1F_10240, partial [Myxococcota bacterium]